MRRSARPRIGLSATQRPIETVARLLVGDRPLPAIVDAGHQRDLDLALELPDGELEAVTSAEQMADVLDRIAELVGEHRTTLVFVNTRRLAERLAHQLGERLGDDVVAAHHGSLSKDRRHRVETPAARRRAARRSSPPRRSSSASTSARSSSCARSARRAASPRSCSGSAARTTPAPARPKGRLYPLTRDELVECAALLAAVRAGRLDAIQLAAPAARHRSPSRSSPRSARRSGAPTTSSRSCAAPRRTPS